MGRKQHKGAESPWYSHGQCLRRVGSCQGELTRVQVGRSIRKVGDKSVSLGSWGSVVLAVLVAEKKGVRRERHEKSWV